MKSSRILLFLLLTAGILQAGPDRIVSLAPVLTEQVRLLRETKRLAGVTAFCPQPEGEERIPSVGNIMELNTERILTLKPDLVLASDINSRSGLDRLEQLGLTVRFIPEGKDFDSICAGFLELSGLLGRKERGGNLIAGWKKEAGKFRPAHPKGQRVFVIVGSRPLITAGRESYLSAILSFAGGANAVEKKTPWIRYSTEEVLKDRPDLILIALSGAAAREEETFWKKKGFRTAIADPDLFGLATPPRFLRSASFLRDLLEGNISR